MGDRNDYLLVAVVAVGAVGAGEVRAGGVTVTTEPGRAGQASLTLATERAADLARLALEAVVALFTAGENTALLLEISHAYSWESRSSVVLGSVVVDFVDRDGGVDDNRLDGFYEGVRVQDNVGQTRKHIPLWTTGWMVS